MHVEAACRGHDIVVHLASSTDIPGGAEDPRLDFEGCVVGTSNLLRATQRTGIRRLVHASSGVVYGSVVARPSNESVGPLLPESHAHLGGWRAVIFRFGNVIGARTNHGVVHDFVVKLLRDPSRLDVLGDGRQAKPFISVADLVRGIRVASAASVNGPVTTYNVATDGAVALSDVARIVAVALGLDPDAVSVEPSTQRRGWPGDTTQVNLDCQALRALGWSPALDGREAVLTAARGIAARFAPRVLPCSSGWSDDGRPYVAT